MFKFHQKGLFLTFSSVVLALTVFFVGCRDSSNNRDISSNNPGTPLPPGDPKDNRDDIVVTIMTASEVNDANVENFKISGACVEGIDGGGDVTLDIGGRRAASGPCVSGIYTFVIDLTQFTLSNPVTIKVSQRVNGVTISESRVVPQGYRTDDPPPENPVVATTIELIHPMLSPSEVLSPVLRVNNRFPGDTVKLYTNRRCTEASLVGTETVLEPAQDSEDPEEGTYARFKIGPLTPGKYRFYETSSNSHGTTTCNIGSLEYDLRPSPGSPKSPWLLLITDPLRTDKSLDQTPTVRVYGVTPGNTVSLHLTKHCNDTAVASLEIPEDQSYADLTPGGDLDPGVYLFRAKTRNFYGWSYCSLTGTYYTVLTPNPISSLHLSDPSSSPGTDLTPTITVSGVEEGDTVHLYKSDCTASLGSGVVAAGDTSVEITVNAGVFTDVGTYNIYARITEREDSDAVFACTPQNQAVEYEIQRPDPPTLAFAGGLSSPGTNTRPTITLSNLQEGDRVALYRDDQCSSVIGSGVVATGDTSVDVTVSSRLSLGDHTFRAKITQREDTLPSDCSPDAQALDYTLQSI